MKGVFVLLDTFFCSVRLREGEIVLGGVNRFPYGELGSGGDWAPPPAWQWFGVDCCTLGVKMFGCLQNATMGGGVGMAAMSTTGQWSQLRQRGSSQNTAV